MITLLANCFVPFKWTPKLRSLRGLLRSLVVKSLIDNIFIKTLGFSLLIHIDYLFTGSESLTQKLKRNAIKKSFDIQAIIGGFQLEFVSISRVINHMTC